MTIDNNYPTKAQAAVSKIKEAILRGQYLPGVRLVPTKLEKELNLGRITIREALKDLVASGMVVDMPHKGIWVAEPPSMEELERIFELRYFLEGKAVEMAAENIDTPTLELLFGMCAEMDGLVAQWLAGGHVSGFDFFLLNRRFHMTICRTAGWNMLLEMVFRLFDKIQLARANFPGHPNPAFYTRHLSKTNNEHQNIVNALEKGDSFLAREYTVINIRRAHLFFRELQKELE